MLNLATFRASGKGFPMVLCGLKKGMLACVPTWPVASGTSAVPTVIEPHLGCIH